MSSTTNNTSTMTTSITSPTTSGPRPLQLVEGASSPVSPAPATAPLPSSSRTGYPSPLSSGLPTPPYTSSTPKATRRPTSLRNTRRQSSISYFPSDHLAELRSPSPRLPPVSSPLSPGPSPRPSGFPFRGGARRSTSLSVRTGEPIHTTPLFSKGANKGDRRSLGSENGLPSPSPGVGSEPERAPLTLTEKHADLLRFIAQKESKCLELRSQLAVHEAELKELKRKWERIVSRGMDRAYSSTPSSANVSPNLSSNPHATHGLAAALLPTGNTGAVLGGIKEGVQDLGRLLAAGLDLSGGTMEERSSPAPTTHVGGDLSGVSRASMAPALKKVRHMTTQSVSSVSTSTTTASDSTAGTRLSQSSVSSLSFLEDEEKVICEEPDEEETRRWDLPTSDTTTIQEQTQTEDGLPSESVVISNSTPSESKSAKLLRRRSREVPKLPSSVDSTESPGFPDADNASPKFSPVATSNAPAKKRVTVKRASTGTASPPSLSGLTPLSQPMASWMGTVGKKWEEIQKGETFTKSQKRASLLLSDVSQSFFAALASPTTPASMANTSQHTQNKSHTSQRVSSSISVSTNPFLATISPLSPSPSPLSSSALGTSLLDDDPEEGQDAMSMINGKGLGEVLVPTTVIPTKDSHSSGEQKSLIDDDDDWNW